ncbi:MAG: molybdopterin-dependent oxidoreductase [Deltaproteobacteria bacterium]|nr:molybdopterin-dependent oxidoreductase [Deltaproteobacteria bacterium]
MSTGEIHHRSCNLCEAMCGLLIEHDGRGVLGIRGDPDDPLSRGHLCAKAFALRDVYEDPDRLRRPLRRLQSGDFGEIGWDEALDEAASRIAEVQRSHGRDAVAVYQGNPSVHNLGTMLFAPQLVRALRTRNRFSASSVDQLPHHFAAWLLFGHQFLLPVPDIDRTDHLLVLGANPLVSNGSLMSAPGMRTRLRALRQRGGSLVVVDPRRTETAAVADAHHFIRPGTDALLLAALCHRVLHVHRPELRHLRGVVDGVDALGAALQPFAPAAVAAPTGIDAAAIEAMADAFVAAPRSACYGRLGICTAEFGGLAMWLVAVLNLLTGNLDREGGMMFTSPAVDVMARTSRGGFGRWASRVRGAREFGGELPVAVLAEEITTPGEGQVRALITSAGNPVLSTPGGQHLARALQQLDFMVAIDIYRNETTRFADLILPPRTGLEVPHYDVVFHSLAVRNTARFADRLFAGDPGGRDDWQIYAGLLERLAPLRGPVLARAAGLASRRLSPTRQLDFALRTGPYGGLGGRRLQRGALSVGALRRQPHGVDLGALRPGQLPARLQTEGRRVDLHPEPIAADLQRLAASLRPAAATSVAPDAEDDFDLRLIGRRGLSDCNSWLHNAPSLMKGRDRCVLLLHPDDAAQRAITDGAEVTIRSRVGEVRAPVRLSREVMPGVVSLPHGFGHGVQGASLRVAEAHAGVSINDLTDPSAIDALTGNAVFSGVPVQVRATATASAASAPG